MKSVAIDGPSGAGKSTVARRLAQQLGYIYVDTGALYRAIGLLAHQMGISPDDETALAPALAKARLRLRYVDGMQRVFLNGADVSEEIRTPEMSYAASQVSKLPAVRDGLFELQRKMAQENNVIMDGRDIGTVVLPDADVKIFLTASAEARAQRRYREHLAKGESPGYNEILEDMRQRDHSDETRTIAPLRRAEDAVLLDTSELELEAVIEAALEILYKRGMG